MVTVLTMTMIKWWRLHGLVSRLVAIVNRLTAGWHWQAVDDLTELEPGNDGLVERRPCPSASAWRRLKESAWSAPFAYEPWARAVPVGEFLGSRMPAGHVSRRDRWPCSDVDVFPPVLIVADACWFRGATKRARTYVTPGQFMSVAKMCASMKTHGRSPAFSWIRSSLNPTTESLLRHGSHFISRAHALGNPPDVTPVVAVGHVTVWDSGSPSYSEMKPHSMHWRSGPTISGLPWPYSSTASTRVSHTRLWAVGPGRGRRMRPRAPGSWWLMSY